MLDKASMSKITIAMYILYISCCTTLTCLSLKLRRWYFYIISTVSMLLVIIIINFDYCHIALYKMNWILLLLL